MPRDEDGQRHTYYDRDKFKMELADDMNVGDMSVTFKLKVNAVFHDGTPVTAKDVKWSPTVTVGGFPTFRWAQDRWRS
jgi:peptide/nickel transport system substrate-binding protein